MEFKIGDDVYVTKYAMTTGVVRTVVSGDPRVLVPVLWPKAPGGYAMFDPRHVCHTEEEARARFKQLQAKAIESAKRRLEKAQCATFMVKG